MRITVHVHDVGRQTIELWDEIGNPQKLGYCCRTAGDVVVTVLENIERVRGFGFSQFEVIIPHTAYSDPVAVGLERKNRPGVKVIRGAPITTASGKCPECGGKLGHRHLPSCSQHAALPAMTQAIAIPEELKNTAPSRLIAAKDAIRDALARGVSKGALHAALHHHGARYVSELPEEKLPEFLSRINAL